MRPPLLIVLVLGVACRSAVSPSQDVRGIWVAHLASAYLPDSSWTIALTQSGLNVSGTGNYRGTGGRSGTLTVSGDVHGPLGDTPSGPTISLLLTYDIGQTWPFTGRLTDTRHMSGILGGGPADTVTFVHM